MRYTYLIPHMATANLLLYTIFFSIIPFVLCLFWFYFGRRTEKEGIAAVAYWV